MENDQLWKRITAAFFHKAETQPSEEFVRTVMARVHGLGKTPQKEGFWDAWFVPSFGFGFAALLFLVTLSSARPELSAEALLDQETEAAAVLDYTLEDLR